ncbi:protein lin-52 homolog isoform X1 [Cygnus atratus]|uniref:protein lin-52 homolog isoform X1 n=1 Tax=Cygnus atratus TaxID=8868 RepID=UPI0015D5AF05|nr:protein lin-52 homolog isoform X1 [Cygnus atratus]
MAAAADGADLEASLLSFEKLDRASPDLWPEQLPGVAEFAASFKSPITSSPPKWMAELENDDIDMLKELGSLTTANLMEKVRGLQNLAYQLGLDECSSVFGSILSGPVITGSQHHCPQNRLARYSKNTGCKLSTSDDTELTQKNVMMSTCAIEKGKCFHEMFSSVT